MYIEHDVLNAIVLTNTNSLDQIFIRYVKVADFAMKILSTLKQNLIVQVCTTLSPIHKETVKLTTNKILHGVAS